MRTPGDAGTRTRASPWAANSGRLRSRAEPLGVQPASAEHDGADPRPRRHEQSTLRSLTAALLAAPARGARAGSRTTSRRGLEDHADDHGVLVQRPVPTQGAHPPAQPGQPATISSATGGTPTSQSSP